MITRRFVLIDAFALIFRAFYALPPLINKEGIQLNAAYGFTSALLAAIKEQEPEYLAVGFDLPKPTKRHKEYVEYKAHRAPMPEDLMPQVPYVKEILKVMNIPVIAAEGYEGEDVIATIVAKIRNPKPEIRNKMEFIIVTGDLDCLQLIDKQTKVYSMARGRRPEGALPGGVNQAVMYDEEKVKERYGLKPSQFVDFKALKGDPSDNIPGVPGIGEKGAASLIKQFETLKKLYQTISNFQLSISNQFSISNAEMMKNLAKKLNISEKLLKILIENKEQANLSYKLSKIATDVSLEFNLADARVHDYDQQKVISLFNKLGFKSLISRLPESHQKNNQQTLL